MSNPSPELVRRFTYVVPDEVSKEKHEKVNSLTLEIGAELEAIMPPSREAALALTALQECRMWANAAIATNRK